MTTLTNEQKLWLAEMLPELIVVIPYKPNYLPWIQWREDGKDVTSREWHCIVSLVKSKLTAAQMYCFCDALLEAIRGKDNPEPNWLNSPLSALRIALHPTLEQEVAALQQVLTNEKEKK